MIEHRSLLDEAERLRRSGDYEGANQKREEYFRGKEELRAKAQKEAPDKLAPVDDIYHGMEKSVPGLFNDPKMPQWSDEEKFKAYGPSTQDKVALETKDELSKKMDGRTGTGRGFFDDVGDNPKSKSSSQSEKKPGECIKVAKSDNAAEAKSAEKPDSKSPEGEKAKTAAADSKSPAPAKVKGTASSPKMTRFSRAALRRRHWQTRTPVGALSPHAQL